MASIPVFMMLIGLPMLGFIGVAMQIFLSLRTNKWYGRVLPALDGLAIIGLSVYLVFTMEKTAILNILLLYMLILMLGMILHSAIYFICRMIVKDREKKNVPMMNAEMKKMQLKDL